VGARAAVPGKRATSARRLLALACLMTLLCPSLTRAGATSRKKGKSAKHPVSTQPKRPAGVADVVPVRGSRGPVEEHVHIRRGDTLARLLTSRGLGPGEAATWVRAAARVYDVRGIRPRHGLTLRFDRATRTLEEVRYEIDDRSLLVLARTESGVTAERAGLPYFIEVKGVAGRVERGLQEDAARAGVPQSVVSELAEIFGWELDLARDLRSGDDYRVLYENIWQAGALRPETGKVLAAGIRARGRDVTAVLFEDADGRGGYFKPNGEPVSREFLRYPVEFTEITSEFSGSRRHPILGISRPHLGVDLAAPTGTPVRAVAGGKIVTAGRYGQLGRTVRVEHDGGLTSTYGHLSRIAGRLDEGDAVERGQVIGYVGASGLATGPHLHYAIDREGDYVDPIAVTGAEAGVAIPERARQSFVRVRTTVMRQLAGLPVAGGPLTVSMRSTAVRE
jgi:murein DD-endopeptidase MepM/ murein hydrolase activator NlpD